MGSRAAPSRAIKPCSVRPRDGTDNGWAMGMNRRVLWPAGLWVLSAAGGTVIAWWRESSLAHLFWPGIDFVGQGKCIRLTLLQRIEDDALRWFNASTVWLLAATWILAFIFALVAGWAARPSTSFRAAVRLLAASLAMYALVVAAGLVVVHVYASLRESDPYVLISYSDLAIYAVILLLAPSTILFFAAWLVRGLTLSRSSAIDPDSPPAEPAT
jgi:hypothetical protein